MILLVAPESHQATHFIAISIEESHSQLAATCSVNVADQRNFGKFIRPDCRSAPGLIPLIALKIERIASLSATSRYELLQITLSDETETWSISSMPTSSSALPTFTSSIIGQLSKYAGDRQNGAHSRSILSVKQTETSNDSSSLLLTLIVSIFGSIVIVIAVITMVVGKRKPSSGERNPTPPRIASVSPVASGSNSPSSLGEALLQSNDDAATPSSPRLAGGNTTSSTLATSTSYSPLGASSTVGGVISTSLSPSGRSGLSMSPAMVDSALQSNGLPSARTAISSPGRAQSSLSPQLSARSSKSNPSSAAISRVAGAGVVSAATNQAAAQSNAGGTTSKSTGLGAFIFRKKSERIAFLEPLSTPKARSWAPAVVANASLAGLPNEPVPKAKPKYLISAQTTIKAANARRPVRYQDFVPSNSFNKYGTYSRAHSRQAMHSRSSTAEDDEDFFDSFGGSSKGAKGPNGLPLITAIGGIDSILGDEEGPGGLFVLDNDDWLEDVVEPHPDDPIYKNDTNYTYIDVDSLMPVDDALIDASVELIEAHLSAIASPLVLVAAASEAMAEEAPKKKKKIKRTATGSKRPKQTPNVAESSATAGTHSSSPSATVVEISASPTSPSPPIAASDIFTPTEKNTSDSHSNRPSAHSPRAPAPGTWRPSRNSPVTPIIAIASSRSAENISVSPTATSSAMTPAEPEIKVKRHKDKSPRQIEGTTSEEPAPTVKKRSKKKRSEASPDTTPEESTTEPSTPREKEKKEKEKKRKRREKEQSND